MSEQAKRAEGIMDEYVAWLCYAESATLNLSRIRVCDSDTPGAFKVYRTTALEAAERRGVEKVIRYLQKWYPAHAVEFGISAFKARLLAEGGKHV